MNAANDLTSINPATEEVLARFATLTARERRERLVASLAAFGGWRRTAWEERARLARALAARLTERRADYARQITLEMGKPIAEALAEIDKCALTCRYLAEHGLASLTEEARGDDEARFTVRFEPLGPILAVMPWNFPFWQLFRCAIPTILAGNTVLLKHASNVPGCALAIEDAFRAAGFPVGVFQTLLIDSAAVAELIADDAVRGAAVTGSEAAGAAVAAAAGAAIKPVVLELGGSDPFIVLDDADLDLAARLGARARMQNTGQSCIAAKRFLVDETLADEFTARLVGEIRKLVVGDPLDPQTQIGPLARLDLLTELSEQVAESVDKGARCVLGGIKLPRKGYYFAPTVLEGVFPGLPAADEETFGPLAVVISFTDAAEMLELANGTPFGLGAAIITRDVARGTAMATELEAGSVFINGIVRSDPRAPFGGIKRSGFGRELGREGMRAFVNIKTVCVG